MKKIAEYVLNKSITNFSLNFEFDRNIVSGMGAWGPFTNKDKLNLHQNLA